MRKSTVGILVVSTMLFGQKLIDQTNQISSIDELKYIVDQASRSSQKVFVEDFTGLN